MSKQDKLKQQAAEAALQMISSGDVVGVGSGSTVNYFIEALAKIKNKIEGAVPASKASEKLLRAAGISILDLNSLQELPIYVDGADEFNAHKYLIKGGGGALAREKIIATVAKQFVCIVDASKRVDVLGRFPVAVEVLPMARSYVARELVKLGADPVYRQAFVTDNGNLILDVHNLDLIDPPKMEQILNNISGTVMNGVFAKRRADKIVVASDLGVEVF